ncbi:hypothetical protein GALMADRAFT_218154 [Galerina marginata CBS 339.88]|uniref:mannan endo-1,4-beta-mannosidase n=1 Tax=Galerina marginata (strain CBS 339.88) TaxID=685588 RepID=A0A067TRY2_GALM3|nr:hypothetical protein GALMADRAFT_218154 [Galerina marginata CBS 339.88]
MRPMLVLLFCALLNLTGASSGHKPSLPRGFATQKNGQFLVDGKPFAFVGANSYWMPLLTSPADVHATFKEMQGAGIKVLRTWGFNALNGSEVQGALKSGLTFYQVWNSSEWVLNDGPQGLQKLDFVVNTASQYGIKGSELYINWIAGAGNTHDVFYTDPRIIASYQRYVKTIVNRYKNSPNVFAWELMNEARCLGDLPGGPNCVPGSELLSKWYGQQADFVRSLDPFHMITTGGEGHFFKRDQNIGFWFNGVFVSDYNFNGQAGEDFDEDLQLKNIDFGTYDIPGSNFTIKDWGLLWIQMHAESAKKANKPLILEEFGVFGIQNKTVIYPEWINLALKTKHAILPWQFGMLGLKENGGNRLIKYADALIDGASPDDGFAYYKNQTSVWNIFANAAKVQASRSN